MLEKNDDQIHLDIRVWIIALTTAALLVLIIKTYPG